MQGPGTYGHGTYGSAFILLFISLFYLSHHATATNDQTEISKCPHLLPNLYYALQAAAAAAAAE